MNFKVQFPQNAGNRISEVLDFKISRGRIPPDPPTSARFSASVNKTTGSAPGVTSVVPVTMASCILHNLCEMQNNNFLPEWEEANLPLDEPICRHNDIVAATDAEDTRAALTEFFIEQQP